MMRLSPNLMQFKLERTKIGRIQLLATWARSGRYFFYKIKVIKIQWYVITMFTWPHTKRLTARVISQKVYVKSSSMTPFSARILCRVFSEILWRHIANIPLNIKYKFQFNYNSRSNIIYRKQTNFVEVFRKNAETLYLLISSLQRSLLPQRRQVRRIQRCMVRMSARIHWSFLSQKRVVP